MNLRLVYLPAVAALLLSAPIPATAHLSRHGAEEQHTLPSPAPLATQLARVRALVDAFRESGDDAALAQAAALLDDRELQSDAPVEVLTTAAAVRQSMHQFARALELLDRALLQRPGDTQARLLRASIYTVQGNRARAAADCRAMLHSEVVLRMACLGAVARGGAQSQHAYATLIALIESMGNSPTRGLGMWLHSIAGDLAADQGLADIAIAHYGDALATLERSQVRAALADQLIALARFDEAMQVLEAGSNALPLQVRRFIAARHLGKVRDYQSDIDRIRRTFEQWIRQGDYLHAREMARFFLDVDDDKALAAKLALRNIRVQREPEDIALIRRTGQTLPSAEDAVKPGQKAPDPATASTTRRTGTGWLPDS